MLFENYLSQREKYPLELISKILDRLNSTFITQIDELHTKNETINYWQHPLEALSFKLSSHVASLRKLLMKSSLTYKETSLEILDISSLNIITRAIIENYLTLYHFHFDNISDEQKEFRFLIYIISALKNRQMFSAKFPENAAKKAKDLTEIAKFQKQLKANKYFQALPIRQQEHYLRTKEAKQLNWTTLLDSSDLKTEIFKDTWRLYSNYAHSEFLSVLQIRDINNIPNLMTSAWLNAELSSMVLASAIHKLGNLFKSAQAIIKTLDDEDTKLYRYFLAVGNKGSA